MFNVDYLGGQIGTFAINFSRPAGQVIAQYYEFLRLGREGYTKVQNASYQVAAYLADEIAKLGPYEFICTGRPDEGIPAVCFKLKDGEDPGYTLYDLSERLRLRGWQVPAFTLGGEATDIVVMRIMCRRGFEMDFAELFINLKSDPQKSLLNQQIYPSIKPGYHMNKKHWISVYPGEEISEALLRDLINDSWNLVVDGLAKRDQKRVRPG